MSRPRHPSLPALALLLPLAAVAVAVAAEVPALSAEEQAMMQAFEAAATPGPPHQRMAQTAGNYRLSIRNWSAPDAEPSVEEGRAVRRMILEGRVLQEEVQASMMGRPFIGMGLQGYDNVSGSYWATWNDSMMTGVTVAHGSCDEHHTCSFTGGWNDPISKEKVTARMRSHWPDADTEIFEMFGPGPDGKEMKMMEMTYRREH